MIIHTICGRSARGGEVRLRPHVSRATFSLLWRCALVSLATRAAPGPSFYRSDALCQPVARKLSFLVRSSRPLSLLLIHPSLSSRPCMRFGFRLPQHRVRQPVSSFASVYRGGTPFLPRFRFRSSKHRSNRGAHPQQWPVRPLVPQKQKLTPPCTAHRIRFSRL